MRARILAVLAAVSLLLVGLAWVLLARAPRSDSAKAEPGSPDPDSSGSNVALARPSGGPAPGSLAAASEAPISRAEQVRARFATRRSSGVEGPNSAAETTTGGPRSDSVGGPGPARPQRDLELEPQYITNVISESLIPLLGECFELAGLEEPRGKIVLKFEILGDPELAGAVGETSVIEDQSSFRHAEFEECLINSMLTVEFDPPVQEGVTVVEYPFEFG